MKVKTYDRKPHCDFYMWQKCKKMSYSQRVVTDFSLKYGVTTGFRYTTTRNFVQYQLKKTGQLDNWTTSTRFCLIDNIKLVVKEMDDTIPLRRSVWLNLGNFLLWFLHVEKFQTVITSVIDDYAKDGRLEAVLLLWRFYQELLRAQIIRKH